MNFTAIFCCYVLLPYFASIVSPPQEAITCHAGSMDWIGKYLFKCIQPRKVSSEEVLDPIPKFPHLMTKLFVQKLDHYHFNDKTTWQQKFLIYENHYDGNGVIFLKIGTEDDISDENMQSGRWIDFCRRAKALCVGIERRGYGRNLPNGNLKNETLKYINTDQALADLAWFIYNFRSIKTDVILPEKLKWVAYGTSDQGTLAVWLRMKFPHLVDAVLSLSAPLLAKEQHREYFQFIDEMFNSDDLNKKLKKEIRQAYKEIKEYVTQAKIKKLSKLYNFCYYTLSKTNSYEEIDISFMYFTLSHAVATIMQYGNDEMEYMKKKTNKIMLDNNGQNNNKPEAAIKRFGIVIQKMLQKFHKPCLQIDFQIGVNGYTVSKDGGYLFLDFLLAEVLGNRASLYQKCNEYGRFETYENFFDISIDFKFYMDFCKAVFENLCSKEILEKGVRRTNIFYGGLDIIVSNVIFVYGSNDPYRNLGVINRHPPNTIVYILEGGSTCSELDNYKFTKPEDDKREQIYSQLIKWINLSNNNEAGKDHQLNENNGK